MPPRRLVHYALLEKQYFTFKEEKSITFIDRTDCLFKTAFKNLIYAGLQICICKFSIGLSFCKLRRTDRMDQKWVTIQIVPDTVNIPDCYTFLTEELILPTYQSASNRNDKAILLANKAYENNSFYYFHQCEVEYFKKWLSNSQGIKRSQAGWHDLCAFVFQLLKLTVCLTSKNALSHKISWLWKSTKEGSFVASPHRVHVKNLHMQITYRIQTRTKICPIKWNVIHKSHPLKINSAVRVFYELILPNL